MEEIILQKKAQKTLVIENEKRDYMDILECLPNHLNLDLKTSMSNDDFEKLPTEGYILCICDLLEVEARSKGIPLESDYVFEALCIGIERISKLRQHLNSDCNFIIVTKLPIRYLRDHFKKIENQSNIQAIFGNDYQNVYRKLDANKCLDFGTVYLHKSVRIIIKPYISIANSENPSLEVEKSITKWKKDFTKILRNTFTKKGE